MKFPLTTSCKGAIAAFIPLSVLCLMSVGVPHAKAQTKKVPMADDVFKNIQVLKGLTTDDFLGTMGIMSASIGFDCSECHNNAGTERVNWAADDNGKKLIARRMVTMVNEINKANFGGRARVTCWTCHRGRDVPAATESMETVYGPGPTDPDDVFRQAAGMPPASQIVDRYISAVGGEQKLNAVTSWVGKGKSVGFGGFGGGGVVQIFAKTPDSHTVWIQFPEANGRQDSIRSTNGNTAWIQTPLTIIGRYEATGSELGGAKLDAYVSFPQELKTVLKNLRTGLPQQISDLPGPESQTAGRESEGIGKDVDVDVVQGDGPDGVVATLYFDKKSGLLLRMVRMGQTPIGRVPVQIDYADYRDVNGLKMPFRLLFAWLDGRDSIQLNEIQTNAPIDPLRFGTPDEVAKK